MSAPPSGAPEAAQPQPSGSQPASQQGSRPARETFSRQSMFIFAAIGSAIGLGNIWRFPYISYDNGGGAFLFPYVIALLTAGVPVLILDYVLGHRFRGSAPLVWRRISRRTEAIGWVQVGITYIIAVYYCVILAWAAMYTWFSLKLSWGDDPSAFFSDAFLHADTSAVHSNTMVWPIFIVLAVVWAALTAVMTMGVRKGMGMLSTVFVPILIVLFLILVVRAVFLPGSTLGLQTFFTPDWSALAKPGVWMAAYGQIFYSLAIAFGIMMTQASYLKRRSNLSGLGAVVGLSNSAFEVLAGIGVFATLGFMAAAQHVAVDEVVTSGIGLAFIAFPTIINAMPGGPLFGVLFFGSLFIAGFTSLITIVEVVVAAAQEKFGLARRRASLLVCALCALPSLVFFPVSTGLATLDIVDKFVNVVGIVFIALVSIVVGGWVLGRFPEWRAHVNQVSSLRLGVWWDLSLKIITPLVLGTTFVLETTALIRDGYEDYSPSKIAVFGWALVPLLYGGAWLASRVPWPKGTVVDGPPQGDFGVPLTGRGAPFGQHLEHPEASIAEQRRRHAGAAAHLKAGEHRRDHEETEETEPRA